MWSSPPRLTWKWKRVWAPACVVSSGSATMPESGIPAAWAAAAGTSSASAITATVMALRIRSPDAHPLPHVRKSIARDLAGLQLALLEGRLQPRLVPAQLRIALAHRGQVLDHRLGDGLLEVAVAGVLELRLHRLRRLPVGGGEDVDQVGDAGLAGPAANLAPGVGDRRAELLADRVRLVEHEEGARLPGSGRGHLPLGLLQVHDPGPDLGCAHRGLDQGLAIALVEAAGDLPHQLDVLALVL